MPKPTTLTEWATSDFDEVVNIGGNLILVTNKVEPTASYLDSGVIARQPFPRPYVNYVLNSHGLHIDYLYEGDIGDYKWMGTAITESEMNSRFGGSWTDLGTTTFTMSPSGSETLRLFRKDA